MGTTHIFQNCPPLTLCVHFPTCAGPLLHQKRRNKTWSPSSPKSNRTCKVRVDPTADSGGLSCSTKMNRECERLRRAALHHPRHSECRIILGSRGLSNPCGFQDVAPSFQVFGTNEPFLGPVSHKLSPGMTVNPTHQRNRNRVSKNKHETATILSGPVTDLPATCATCSYLQLRSATPAHFWSRPKNRCFAAGALVPCIWERVLALFVMHCFLLFLLCLETVAWWHMSQ